MLREYPHFTDEEIDRRGEIWLFCDVSTCAAAAKVEGIERVERQVGRHTVASDFAPLPEGWATSDPEKNALNGAADFCPTHADRIYVPPDGAERPPIRDE